MSNYQNSVSYTHLDVYKRQVLHNAAISVRAPLPYVSRGGLKLAAALDAFAVDATGVVAVDIGASTGGFTDCLLQRGAARVYAIDVGYGQLAWKLQTDPRVVVPVSYTHLDVYKRQTLMMAGTYFVEPRGWQRVRAAGWLVACGLCLYTLYRYVLTNPNLLL